MASKTSASGVDIWTCSWFEVIYQPDGRNIRLVDARLSCQPRAGVGALTRARRRRRDSWYRCSARTGYAVEDVAGVKICEALWAGGPAAAVPRVRPDDRCQDAACRELRIDRRRNVASLLGLFQQSNDDARLMLAASANVG